MVSWKMIWSIVVLGMVPRCLLSWPHDSRLVKGWSRGSKKISSSMSRWGGKNVGKQGDHPGRDGSQTDSRCLVPCIFLLLIQVRSVLCPKLDLLRFIKESPAKVIFRNKYQWWKFLWCCLLHDSFTSYICIWKYRKFVCPPPGNPWYPNSIASPWLLEYASSVGW